MRRVIAATFVLSFGLWLGQMAGCSWWQKHVENPPADGGVPADASPGTRLVNCSDAALHAAWTTIVPDAESAMAAGSLEAMAVTMAATVGMPLALAELGCAVTYAINEVQMHARMARGIMASTADPQAETKVANGAAWLASHPEMQFTSVAP